MNEVTENYLNEDYLMIFFSDFDIHEHCVLCYILFVPLSVYIYIYTGLG